MSIYKLSGAFRRVYEKLFDAVSYEANSVRLQKFLLEDVLDIYVKVLSENPRGYLYDPCRLEATEDIFGMNVSFLKCPESEQRILLDSAVRFEADKIISLARRKKSIREQLFCVYSYFVENYRFAENCEGECWDTKFNSGLSPFLYREAVCEGFALALAYILNGLDIPCGIVSGETVLPNMRGLHSWNIVRLNDKYYHLDVSGDICTKKNGGLFDYFLLDDNIISRDHHWRDASLPECIDATEDCYYISGHCCADIAEAKRKLAEAVRRHEEAFAVRIMGREYQRMGEERVIADILTSAAESANSGYSKAEVSGSYRAGTANFFFNY